MPSDIPTLFYNVRNKQYNFGSITLAKIQSSKKSEDWKIFVKQMDKPPHGRS